MSSAEPAPATAVDVTDQVRGALAGCAAGEPVSAGAALSLARALAAGQETGWDAPQPAPQGAHVALLGVPLGLVLAVDPVEELSAAVCDQVAAVDPTRLGLAAVAAVAAAVAAATSGAQWQATLALALAAADTAERRGVPVAGPALSARLRWAEALVARTDADPMEVLDLLVGASGVVQEAVPVAFAVASLWWDDPEGVDQAPVVVDRLTCPDASIGPLVAALLGARHGVGVVGSADVAAVIPDLDDLADRLVGARA